MLVRAATALACLLFLGLFAGCSHGAKKTCAPAGTALAVDVEHRELALCEDGVAASRYRVAIGRRGAGKSRRGDARTPLGAYPLGEVRASSRFGLFLPVGYPTPDQRAAGFTGDAVGVHGPHRSWRWLGPLNVAADWTAGCIVVASDREMQEIARWVARVRPAEIVIR